MTENIDDVLSFDDFLRARKKLEANNNADRTNGDDEGGYLVPKEIIHSSYFDADYPLPGWEFALFRFIGYFLMDRVCDWFRSAWIFHTGEAIKDQGVIKMREWGPCLMQP